MHILRWKKDRRYGKMVFSLPERQSLPNLLEVHFKGGWGRPPESFQVFHLAGAHFKHFLKQNSIKITVFFGLFRNNVISFLFLPGQQNIPAIS